MLLCFSAVVLPAISRVSVMAVQLNSDRERPVTLDWSGRGDGRSAARECQKSMSERMVARVAPKPSYTRAFGLTVKILKHLCT